jgi:hypothetical protein
MKTIAILALCMIVLWGCSNNYDISKSQTNAYCIWLWYSWWYISNDECIAVVGKYCTESKYTYKCYNDILTWSFINNI